MSDWIETFRGVVYPWHCDQLGHMNVQHYVGMFDQATCHLFQGVGISFEEGLERGKTLVDVRHTVEYRAEQRAGSLVKIESAFTKIGTKSVAFMHRMFNCRIGELAATSEVVEVYFDLQTRTSLPIPDELRARIEPHLVRIAP
jgi:acyl-CoA thioester hydrolase